MAAGCVTPAAAASFGTVVPVVGTPPISPSTNSAAICTSPTSRPPDRRALDRRQHRALLDQPLKIPASMALSPDSRYLAVTNYRPQYRCRRRDQWPITLIDLRPIAAELLRRQSAPGVAFYLHCRRCKQALVVTTTAIDHLRPGGRHAAELLPPSPAWRNTLPVAEADLSPAGGGDAVDRFGRPHPCLGHRRAPPIGAARSSSSNTTRPPAAWRPMDG